jgi:GT2 family glycosyltransferase
MKTPYVSVVIPFKGECNLVLDCIYSILNSYISGFSYQIICYDDGSTTQELDYLYTSIRNNFNKDILIVKNNNVEYTQAVYNVTYAMKRDYSNCDYMLLLNSDVKLHRAAFYRMVTRMNSNPNIAAVGAKIVKMGTNEIQHTGTRLENGSIVDPYCGLDMNDPITNQVERRLWVNGCGVLYNLRILRKEDLNFSLSFKPAYFEEADLMTELNVRGYSVLYEPGAIIEHKLNATMNKDRERYEKAFWGNWELYKSKWSEHFGSKALSF